MVEQLGDPGFYLRPDETAMLAEPEAREEATARVVLDRPLPQPEEDGDLAGREDVLASERTVSPRVARRGAAHPFSPSRRSASRITRAMSRASASERCRPSSSAAF